MPWPKSAARDLPETMRFLEPMQSVHQKNREASWTTKRSKVWNFPTRILQKSNGLKLSIYFLGGNIRFKEKKPLPFASHPPGGLPVLGFSGTPLWDPPSHGRPPRRASRQGRKGRGRMAASIFPIVGFTTLALIQERPWFVLKRGWKMDFGSYPPNKKIFKVILGKNGWANCM